MMTMSFYFGVSLLNQISRQKISRFFFNMQIDSPYTVSNVVTNKDFNETIEKIDDPTKLQSKTTINKVAIVLVETDLEEKFVKGSGNGGQKINKTENRVQLLHLPTGIKVSCQDARDLYTNRRIARKLLIEKLDQHFNGSESKIEQEFEKIRKRKQRSARFFFSILFYLNFLFLHFYIN
jgi:protein subunit release factor B